MMKLEQAQARAAQLGLSAWVCQAVAATDEQQTVDRMCVGFRSADLPLAEGATWEEALSGVIRIVFRL